ncbi:trehalose-6-phosphate phosphatase [Fomitiporia mediterranea MF3/22]|uniref:Trehalose-6-phosphate phosphatase n=1 Tax=Fomitiporia mediterranea (strain MF3/22) TaxID=694068 RepID=R7SFX9_FOMME|nr:trehalose-6-phosphate phosphatase [Fomitiporia mediterranea MF3/22]EJC97623.1 trehalose-6-phosphate phosphatase [Fomitiporia mediterranea MF3/22]
MRADLALSLEDVNKQVEALKQEYATKGISLTGRIIHVTHYLPLTASLAPNKNGVLSPPLTPPVKPSDVASESDVLPRWIIGPRWGHSAMFSGIQSLSNAHDQVIIGWIGDLERGSASTGEKVKIPTSAVSDADRAALTEAIERHKSEDGPTRYIPVWLEDNIAHGHYDGYCKTTLWPLFHYLLWQDVATEVASADEHWTEYEEANYVYARRVAEVYKPGDLVWVHDYHLLLVPHLLRQLIPDAITGLFVHTPFPSSEIFRCLPRRKEILDGMLGANLVCFQTYSYSRHFTSSCIRVCGYESASKGIDNQGHVTTVAHCPVGVDAERIAKDVVRPGVQPKLDALRSLYEGKKIIVARDKLDVVKGVVQKLRAFERLLQDYPEWVGNVVLIQVTSPALTDSPKLERQVSELVAHINGEFGALDFVPVHHYHQTIKRDEFYALLSCADLAVITPLRDGMNTTSMEFVIAQQLTKKSPLVLSEFMGISSTMEEALQVNPWDLGGVAAAIHRGLLMSDDDKISRHSKLYKSVTTHTSHTWAALLVRHLLQQIGTEHTAHSTPFLSRERLNEAYAKANRRLFLFDYDGTLTPIVKTPSMAVPSGETLEALEKLSADPKNVVYIISGRDGEFLETHLGHLKKLGMSAEHGSFLREPGQSEWLNLTEKLDMSWMSEVEEIFRYYTERTTGSHIEIKKSSITWHYRSSDPEWGLFQCRQCQDLLENNLARKRPIEVLVGKKNLEVRPLAVNKGEIVKRILYEHPEAEFVFCAGDDKTDEDMFRALAPFTSALNGSSVMDAPVGVELKNGNGNGNGNGEEGTETPPKEIALKPEGVFSIAVGSSSKKTLASWHVTSPHEVVEHLLGLVSQ